MDALERLAEEKIRAAMEAGAFDQLPGRGKPLQLNDNPYEPPEWRLAFHLLRTHGFTLPWLEIRREIEADLQAARTELALAVNQPTWEEAQAHFRARLTILNKRIFNYNLHVPLVRFQLPLLNIEAEIERICQQVRSCQSSAEGKHAPSALS
jgi:DnaJ family protein C protein 28